MMMPPTNALAKATVFRFQPDLPLAIFHDTAAVIANTIKTGIIEAPPLTSLAYCCFSAISAATCRWLTGHDTPGYTVDLIDHMCGAPRLVDPGNQQRRSEAHSKNQYGKKTLIHSSPLIALKSPCKPFEPTNDVRFLRRHLTSFNLRNAQGAIPVI